MKTEDYQIVNREGARLYLTTEERNLFVRLIDEALDAPAERERRTFCLLLYWTGCRISEGLMVRYRDIDFSAGGVTFQTLKRRKIIHRFVPLPEAFLTKLDDVHRIADVIRDGRKSKIREQIWPMSRTTAWRSVKQVMEFSGIRGPHATAKGLRHAFVIAHQHVATPEHMIQRWMGWASRDMMAVYGRAIGMDERDMARRLWK